MDEGLKENCALHFSFLLSAEILFGYYLIYIIVEK